MRGRRAEDLHHSSFQFPSLRPHCAAMLRVTFLGCVLIFPTLFASAFAGELDFGAENFVANIVQIPLNHSDNYQPVCHGISRNISPALQVFYPGAVFAFLSEKSLMSTLRFPSIRGRHHTLGQLEFTDICMLRAAWLSRGPQLYRS
jgi:hypothetical protein